MGQENLPANFIQRLRDWAHDTCNAVAHSAALDLEKVNDRLLRIAGQHEPKAEPMSPYRPGKSPTRSPSPPQRGETEFYFKLVNNGGRPMYPFDLIDTVAQNPTAYRHLVRPWSDSADSELPEWWLVFEPQFHHREQFRQWQVHARREGIPSRVEIRFDTRWRHVDTAYARFVRDFRLESPTYADAALQLLGRHGFTRPVQFHPDVFQQVEAILDGRRRKGRKGRKAGWEYLVKWAGYGHEHNSWEPGAHFEQCPEILQQFHQRKGLPISS